MCSWFIALVFLVGRALGCGLQQKSNATLTKVSNLVQNIFFLYDVADFAEIGHSISVATKSKTL